MSQVMIIAKMKPDHASDVAGIFARYDATEMPHEIGVTRRSLYRFHDLYVHLVDFWRPAQQAMVLAQRMPLFKSVSDELQPYITAYDPDWNAPRDAMAARFYDWAPSESEASPQSRPSRRRAFVDVVPTLPEIANT